MGKITEISPQARDKTRVNVYIDGAFVCGLSSVSEGMKTDFRLPLSLNMS